MKFIGKCFQKLEPEDDRHTDKVTQTHTDATERITTLHSWVAFSIRTIRHNH